MIGGCRELLVSTRRRAMVDVNTNVYKGVWGVIERSTRTSLAVQWVEPKNHRGEVTDKVQIQRRRVPSM